MDDGGARGPAAVCLREVVDHLFVYGTLRRAAAHPMHALLSAAADSIGAARVRGRLYQLGHYPGLVLDDRAGWVVGELFFVHDPSVYAVLDEYEGAAPTDRPPHEYARVVGQVARAEGLQVSAWIYEYRWSVVGRAVISSGDFLKSSESQ